MAAQKKNAPSTAPASKVTITRDGPYVVTGGIPLYHEEIESDKLGRAVRWTNQRRFPDRKTYSLCRCGRSCHMPVCDNSHKAAHFDGTETASRVPYEEAATKTYGPELVLTDAKDLCAGARFCDRAGGTWSLTERSDDPRARATAIQQAADCPSGRLEAWDRRTGESLDPELEPSISLVEDPAAKVSGPIWVKGGVPIESCDGGKYEARNRVTLCRCGESGNKPFCDGSHISGGFKATGPQSGH